jgi:hypothetical protein
VDRRVVSPPNTQSRQLIMVQTGRFQPVIRYRRRRGLEQLEREQRSSSWRAPQRISWY